MPTGESAPVSEILGQGIEQASYFVEACLGVDMPPERESLFSPDEPGQQLAIDLLAGYTRNTLLRRVYTGGGPTFRSSVGRALAYINGRPVSKISDEYDLTAGPVILGRINRSGGR